jgi:predicted transcriptional regulator of viral defense system
MADTASGDGGHPRSVATQAGGIDNVATVLAEFAEKLDDAVLASLAPLSPVPWAQRLGHLLEQVGASDKAESLARYFAGVVNETTALAPSAPTDEAPHDAQWRLLVNVSVEPEL